MTKMNILNPKRVKHNVKDLCNPQTKPDISYRAKMYPAFNYFVYYVFEALQLSLWLIFQVSWSISV